MALSSINESSLTLSALRQENQVMKNKNFHGAFQSNYVIFVGFSHVKFGCAEDGDF